MDQYSQVAGMLSALFTKQYSTSFSTASSLFPAAVRKNIYAIYGLVRIADEIVDTYAGKDRSALLDALEDEINAALRRGFSTNPLVHAFADTARTNGIGDQLMRPFFESMRMDLTLRKHSKESYQRYIHGSAEVVGLMCLKVFCGTDDNQYAKLAPGAERLGAAFQKINFLRDVAADYNGLGRFYFPDTTFADLDEPAKQKIIADIKADLAAARPYVANLPASARKAVGLSARYYVALLTQLEKMPVAAIKQGRASVPRPQKLRMLIAAKAGRS